MVNSGTDKFAPVRWRALAMALDMDPKICSEMFSHPNILWRRKTYLIRRVIRRGLREFEGLRARTTINFQPQWNSFAENSVALDRDGYVFIENFLTDSDYGILKDNWPKNRYFTPVTPNEDHKTSDKGLYCQHEKPGFDVGRNPVIYGLYKMFMSKNFRDEVTVLCGDDVARVPYHLLVQNSFWGSGLAPHRDSHDDVLKSKINFIYFVESNGSGWDAGGTAILKSNDFTKPIFIPFNLNNSCLFYYSESELFHGFPMIKFGKYRKNVIAHFCAS
jgi:hypothetical protein